MQFARRARLGDTQPVVSSLINDLRQPFHQRQYESSQIRATVRTSGRRHLGNVRERYPEWVGTKTWEERSTPQWARTTNLRFRRPMLYPIELRVPDEPGLVLFLLYDDDAWGPVGLGRRSARK